MYLQCLSFAGATWWNGLPKWEVKSTTPLFDRSTNERDPFECIVLGHPTNIAPLKVSLYFIFTMRAMVSFELFWGKSPPWPTYNLAPQPMQIPSGSLLVGGPSNILGEWFTEVGGACVGSARDCCPGVRKHGQSHGLKKREKTPFLQLKMSGKVKWHIVWLYVVWGSFSQGIWIWHQNSLNVSYSLRYNHFKVVFGKGGPDRTPFRIGVKISLQCENTNIGPPEPTRTLLNWVVLYETD